MLVILLLYFCTILILMLKFGFSILEPPVLFLVPWIIGITFLLLGPIAVKNPLVTTTFYSISASVTAFLVGALIRRKISPQKMRNDHQGLSAYSLAYPFTIIFLAGGALIYTLIVSYESVSIIASKGLNSINLFDMRTEHVSSYLDGRISLTQLPKSLVRPFAMLFGFSIMYFVKLKRYVLIILSGFSCFTLVAESLLIGGRFMIIYLLFGTFYFTLLLPIIFQGSEYKDNLIIIYKKLLFMIKKIGIVKIAFLFVLAFVFLYLTFLYWPSKLNPYLTDEYELYLKLKHDWALSNWAWEASRIPGFAWIGPFANGISYLGMPIVKYTFFCQNSNIGEWFYFGNYNFPIFSKIQAMFGNNISLWHEIRGAIADISISQGYGGNPWATTGVRDFVIDFGYSGTVVLLFLWGYFSQSIFMKMLRFPSYERVLLSVSMGLCGGIFYFLSPFLLGIVFNTLIVCFVLLFIKRLNVRRISSQ